VTAVQADASTVTLISSESMAERRIAKGRLRRAEPSRASLLREIIILSLQSLI
jgi:hypothetical protein